MRADHGNFGEYFDVVIIGAGAAGITLALRLSDAGVKTALLEGGDYKPSNASQQLYEGFNEGIKYSLIKSRQRFFGGTTNHWTGYCRPLDPATFAPRESIDYPGWPIDRDALAPYLRQALEIVDIKPDVPWEPLPGSEAGRFDHAVARAGFREVYFQFSKPTRFKNKFRKQLQRTAGLTIGVNESLIDLEFTSDGEITGAIVKNLKTNKQRTITARLFVLACGGIENARLLLHINANNGVSFGNRSGQLGRSFMEHPHYPKVGRVVLFDEDYRHRIANRKRLRAFVLDDEVVRARGILHTAVRMRPEKRKRRFIAKLREIGDFPDTGGWQVFRLDAVGEQLPSAASTVTLSEETDALGVSKAILNWHMSELDYRSIRQTLLAFSQAMIDADVGRCWFKPWVSEGGTPSPPDEGNHHMGTTRMGHGDFEGVVDPDCRLFGTTNLYVAGSSVFPTAGYANPTLTIVQLALRLADHITHRLR